MRYFVLLHFLPAQQTVIASKLQIIYLDILP